MLNFNDFLKSGIPEMLIEAMAEAAQEVAQEERDTRNAKQTTEESIKKDHSKALTLANVKKAAQIIGEEDCKRCEKMVASAFYTYASFIEAGFSSREAFELIKAVLMYGFTTN